MRWLLASQEGPRVKQDEAAAKETVSSQWVLATAILLAIQKIMTTFAVLNGRTDGGEK